MSSNDIPTWRPPPPPPQQNHPQASSRRARIAGIRVEIVFSSATDPRREP